MLRVVVELPLLSLNRRDFKVKICSDIGVHFHQISHNYCLIHVVLVVPEGVFELYRFGLRVCVECGRSLDANDAVMCKRCYKSLEWTDSE